MGIRSDLMGLGKQAQKLRNKDNLGWFEIGQKLGVPQGKALAAYEVAEVTEANVFKGTEPQVAKEIVRLRDKEGLSWARIAARVDITEASCRTIYEKTSGTPHRGNRIGKGGRYPSDVERPATPTKAAPAKKAPAKATGTKKAPAKAAGTTAKRAARGTAGAEKRTGGTTKKVAIQQMNQDQITARLTNAVIGVEQDGKTRRFKVSRVVNLTGPGGELTFADAKGKEHTVEVNDIASAR